MIEDLRSEPLFVMRLKVAFDRAQRIAGWLSADAASIRSMEACSKVRA